ncbi:hypothetical protein BWK47_09835 [Synechocystis sp. CACIAM 05]|nr:hypothetical protein BWK47_09835 [Synechocystis sp. CACIAM 05]
MLMRRQKLELITRKQLLELGLTSYQAQRITKELKPISKTKRGKNYNIQEVILSINTLLENKRIQKRTRTSLKKVIDILIPTLDNIIPISFTQENTSELQQLAQQALTTTLEVSRKLAKLERRSLEIKGRYE